MDNACNREARWPIWLWVVGLLIVFAPLLEGGTTHLAVMIIRLLILALAVCYVWKGVGAGAFASPLLVIKWPVLAFLALALTSTVTSSYSHQSWQWLLVLGSYAGLLALLGCFLRRWGHIVSVISVFVMTAVGEAGYALVQGWQGAVRPSGTFFNPNFLAVYLGCAWVVIFAYVCYAIPCRTITWVPQRPIKTQSPATRFHLAGAWGAAAMLIMLAWTIVLTGSRGGLLALACGAALVTSMRFGRRALALLLVLLLVAFILPSPFQDRLLAEHRVNLETYARWHMWGQSVFESVDHPLGIGLGLYQYWAPRYMFPVEGQIVRYGKIATTAHNEYLQMAVELGAASLPIFLWGGWLVGREGARVLEHRLRRRQRAIVVGLLGAILILLVHAAVDSTFHEPALALLLTLCVGMVLAASRLVMRRPSESTAIPLTSRPLWGAIGLLAVLVLAGEIARLGIAWQTYEAGNRAASRDDVGQAVAQYRAAIALDSGKALYHSALAAAYFQRFESTQDPDAAQAALRELHVAMSLNPVDGRLAALLGHVCESAAKSGLAELRLPGTRVWLLTAARGAYERAVELEPFVVFYRLEVGRLAFALGDRADAESWVRGAVELEPNFLPGREWLARWYLKSGRPEAATRELQEIRKRVQRYAAWTMDGLETRFLKVDVRSLEAAMTIEEKTS